MTEALSLEEAWTRLKLHLEWADAFWIVFVFTNDPRVSQELARRTQAQIEGAGRRFVGLRPAPDEDLREALADGEARAVAWVDMVRHDAKPEAPVWRTSWERGLMRLNERREWLRRRWEGGGIVLVTTGDRLDASPMLAPDLWSVRAMILRVAGMGFELESALKVPSLFRPLSRTINPELQRQEIARARASGDDFALARALSLLAQVSEREEGLSLAKEGLALADALSSSVEPEARSLAELDHLGSMFTLFGEALESLADPEHELEAYQRAVDLRRQIVRVGGSKYLSQLGSSLVALATSLGNVGCFALARERASEAVDIYRQLAGADPQRFIVLLAAALNNVAAAESSLGEHEDALATAGEAIELLRSRGERDSGLTRWVLGVSLDNLGVFSIRHGQLDEAIAATREALAIYTEFVASQPEGFVRVYSQNLERLVTWLRKGGRVEEALEVLDEACALYRRFVGDELPEVAASLAAALEARGAVLLELGRREEADASVAEALSYAVGTSGAVDGADHGPGGGTEAD
ncbi:tetratricopeptide repeat protein [Pseudenhygromyxa sp. WMMC2535]|uniref:tetratricopeptide repeat protein n=1 Tax=Pseudenhygromyxa sp. WMMC2535 TaxID=2712867 RepID=UPI001556F793|nr:tetratricopeptide repeat protein [Pseudenhygromyxa sp. WMMC2535]NVB38655.1 tetratricopeptide repeat protein [Pseudenhygromyxa sp. WMMC2535]